MIGDDVVDCGELSRTILKILGDVFKIEEVEDVVFDCGGDGSGFVTIDSNGLVNLLKR